VTATPLLSCREVDVSFGEVAVLEEASLEVRPGEVHFLIGPNGAGKTTLANVVTGHVAAAAGSVEFDGAPLAGAPWRRARRGIGRKFQVPRVFPRLDARQNVEIADRRPPLDELEARLLELGSAPAETLSHGWRQWLELQMTLVRRPKLVVLDEPTAGMTREDRDRLAERIRELAGETTFLVVEHDIDFVAQVADRVSFLHEGRLLRTGPFAEIAADPLVRSSYLGERVL
jgi:urea transport system ATP-binding protein